ncbi:MAG: 50S ribosomal protein L21 [Polyangiaceae bacterium]|nr:50S ribosomal protein L21 [Polyangiaceae bacterium]
MRAAVISTGGKQYRVAEGDTIRIEKLPGDPGTEIVFDHVLFVGGDTAKIGKPTVAGAKVVGTITGQTRGEKLVVFKFKRRKRHRRKAGHRQQLTQVKITAIQG